MGKLNNGINGAFTGKVGAVVGSACNGVPYIKARYKKRTKRISEKELQNRDRFSKVHFWLQPLLPFTREGFKNYSQQSRGFNAAKSLLLKNSIEGSSPAIRINPALVKLSAGNLPLPLTITAERTSPGEITFRWDKGYVEGGSSHDQVMVAAYNINDKRARQNITGQFRYTGTDTLPVDQGKTYHIYVAFTAADRSRQSDSMYLGEL